MAEREIFINCVNLVEFDDDTNIRTAILYDKDSKPRIGNSAVGTTESLQRANQDFKIDLGLFDPKSKQRKHYDCGDGSGRPATALATDFLYEILVGTKKWLASRGVAECRHVVVAEPLSLDMHDITSEWLQNYRDALRRILTGKRVLSPEGLELRFVPEPFAAFQYYRYGLKHPLVTRQEQMNVLVVDFGGGTCDVCIIQTTKDGDISGGGRNKRPLAGKSLNVGGFYVNRQIAEHLMRTHLAPTAKNDFKEGLRLYGEWVNGTQALESLKERFQCFIRNYHGLSHRVENVKLALCKNTHRWGLDEQLTFAAPVSIPADPFSADARSKNVTFSCTDLRSLFEEKIYRARIKNFLKERLAAAADELDGEPISVVLMSGGSANIGWLRELIERDFGTELQGAPFVTIPEYQEVVAKGLAVDCARAFSTGRGDFQGVTYNPLFLQLPADESELQPWVFQKRSELVPDVSKSPGLLLPTASLMADLIGKPLLWKVKLNKAPRRRLEYKFLQGTMDPDSAKALQNVEETVLHTPKGTAFDDAIHVELTLSGDGTALPRVIYRAGTDRVAEVAEAGRKFALDVTDVGTGNVAEAYLGLDFGTSNTAVSYIERGWVQEFTRQDQTSSYMDPAKLIDELPGPLALPLARHIGDHSAKGAVRPGISFVESALCLAAYVSYADYCHVNQGKKKTAIFKNFPHRSASYLWRLIQDVHGQMGERSDFSKEFGTLVRTDRFRQLLDTVTRTWAKERHEGQALDDGVLNEAISVLARASHGVFSRMKFGYFEGVQRRGFSRGYVGRYRLAYGRPPYAEYLDYAGADDFTPGTAFLLDPDRRIALPLQPFVIWAPCLSHSDAENGHCYFLDKVDSRGVGPVKVLYKATNNSCNLEVESKNPDMGALVDEAARFSTEDSAIQLISDIGLVTDE